MIKVCHPKKLIVKLEQDNMEADVVVFDVKEMLASFFYSPELNQCQNLVINSRDRFAKYETDDWLLGEVSSGTWYDIAYNKCITDANKDFICPFVFASNKTTLSQVRNLHVDAIFMTTSICIIQVKTIIMLL